MPRIKSTSGGKEEQVLSRARELRRDPEKLLPELSDDCPTAPFDRLRGELERVKEAAGDADELRRLMARGGDLSRAYAAILYFLEERPDAVTVLARSPTGTIPYLAIGSAPPEANIAVQYFQDPRRLLMGYLKLAKGGLFSGVGLYFYALKDGIVCTGRNPKPPERFISASISRLPYRLSQLDTEGHRNMVCQHLAKGEMQPHLEVIWDSARLSFKVCKRCSRDDSHLLGSLIENMAVPDPQSEFQLALKYPLQHDHKDACQSTRLPGMSPSSERSYRKGKLSDSAFLNEFTRDTEEMIRGIRGRLFIAGGHCYGGDVEKLIEDLNPTPAERIALSHVLPSRDTPLLIQERTAGKALEALWKDHALELIVGMGTMEDEAEKLAAEFQSSPGRVSELIERLYKAERERSLLSGLPNYTDVSPEAQFAIDIARSYRTQGAGAVEKRLTSDLPQDGKIRGMAWGFLIALGKAGEGHDWRFSKTEREFGEALSPSAKKLLLAPDEHYHSSLSELLSMAGVANWGHKVE